MSDQNQNNQEVNRGGVKTLEGKAIVRFNARKHAILGGLILDGEQSIVEVLFDDLVEDLKPEGIMQELLVESIAANIIKLQRISKAESALIKENVETPTLMDMTIGGYITTDKLLLYSRYQTATENRIFRALAALKHFS